MKNKLIITLITMAITWSAMASITKSATGPEDPNAWNWGSNKVEAQGKWMFLNSSLEEKNYAAALEPARWLLTNTPNLNVALYINAAKIFEKAVKAEKEPVRKKELQDTVLLIYNERVKLYGDEAYVLNRMGRVAWKYQYKDKSKLDDLYVLYKKIDEMNGPEMLTTNVTYYMHAACEETRKGELAEDELIDLYTHLNDILDIQTGKAAGDATKLQRIEKSRLKVEKDLLRTVTVDCDFVQDKLGPKYRAEPNMKIAKQINGLLVSNKCISNDLYINTAEFILASEPSVERLRMTAKVYKIRNEYDSAFSKFKQALNFETDAAKKGSLYFEMANIKNSKGLNSEARSLYRQAMSEDNAIAADCYNKIGGMYMSSYNKCKSDDVLQSRAIFIAAYNMYSKAGNSTKMNECKSQFPSTEEIFVRGKKVGDAISVKCWIGETVNLQKRD